MANRVVVVGTVELTVIKVTNMFLNLFLLRVLFVGVTEHQMEPPKINNKIN